MIIEVVLQDGFFNEFPLIQKILEINKGLENPCEIQKVIYNNGFGERKIVVVTNKDGSKPDGYDDNFLELVFECTEKDEILSEYQFEEYDHIDSFSQEHDQFTVFL